MCGWATCIDASAIAIQLYMYMQAARDDKARLEGAVISAGRQLKKAMSQRDSLVANMEKAIAQETARNLETLYGPLVDGYRKRCMCLEDQLRHVPPPRHTCGPACPPQPVPEQKKGAARVRPTICLKAAKHRPESGYMCMLGRQWWEQGACSEQVYERAPGACRDHLRALRRRNCVLPRTCPLLPTTIPRNTQLQGTMPPRHHLSRATPRSLSSCSGSQSARAAAVSRGPRHGA